MQIKSHNKSEKKNEESDKKPLTKEPVVVSNKTRNTEKEITSKKLFLRTESTNVNSNSSNKDDLNMSCKYNFSKSKTIRNYSFSIANKLSFSKKIEISSDKEKIKRNLSAKNNKEHFDNIEVENLNYNEETKVINEKSYFSSFNTGDLSSFKTKILKKISGKKLSYK